MRPEVDMLQSYDQHCARSKTCQTCQTVLETILRFIVIVQLIFLKLRWLSLSRFASKNSNLEVSAASLAVVRIVEKERSLFQHSLANNIGAAVEYRECYPATQLIFLAHAPGEQTAAFDE